MRRADSGLLMLGILAAAASAGGAPVQGIGPSPGPFVCPVERIPAGPGAGKHYRGKLPKGTRPRRRAWKIVP